MVPVGLAYTRLKVTIDTIVLFAFVLIYSASKLYKNHRMVKLRKALVNCVLHAEEYRHDFHH